MKEGRTDGTDADSLLFIIIIALRQSKLDACIAARFASAIDRIATKHKKNSMRHGSIRWRMDVPTM
jgi:hypothetical protein